LDVSPGASEADLKAAHRRESKRYHPDRCPAEKTGARKFRLVQNAYRCLSRGEECEKLLRAQDAGELPDPAPDNGPNNRWAYFLRWRNRFF
jgi:curved DNA-binding protein